jgi:phosphate transport system protein
MDPSDLRSVLTIVKVNNELERIADCAVEVAGLVRRHAGTTGAYPDTFRVMANSVIGILRDTNLAVQRGDAALAKVVLQSQHAVTAFKAALLRDAEEKIARGAMQVDFAFQLHEMATECERIADHCTNIAEQVIYQTTGAIVRHTDAQWVITRPAD